MIFEVGTNPKYKKIMSAIFTFTLHTKSVNLLYYLCAFYNIYPQCEIFNIFYQSEIFACNFQSRNLNNYSFEWMFKKNYQDIFFMLTFILYFFSIVKVPFEIISLKVHTAKEWFIKSFKLKGTGLNGNKLKCIIGTHGHWKKTKSWGLFWHYQLNSTAYSAHLAQFRGKWAR